MNISFGQILIILILGVLFFGDLSHLTKNLNLAIKKLKKRKSGKKGFEPMTFGFGNRCSTN